jgi:hypothetical protein
MKAKIKDDYRWKAARACNGAEFVKSEFRPVPAGLEGEASRVPFLEFEPEAEQAVEGEPEPTPAPTRGKGRGRVREEPEGEE